MNERSPMLGRVAAVLLLGVLLAAAHGLQPTAVHAATGDIAVGGVWVFRLTQGAAGLTVEQRVRQVEQRITDVLSRPRVMRDRLTVEVQSAGGAAAIVAAQVTVVTVTPADAAGTGVSVDELANQWAGRLVQGLRRALPGREIVGLMYTQPRGSDPREPGRVVGPTWYWRRTLTPAGAQVQPADPRLYTVQFLRGGRMVVRADCNRGEGPYVLRGSRITMGPWGMTKAMCPTGSLDWRFVEDLRKTSTFTVRAGILLLAFPDGGTMRFSQLLP